MEDNFIIHGPELWTPIPEISLGKQLYDSFLTTADKDVAFVDSITEKKLSYHKFFEITRRLALSLSNCGYRQNTVISVCSENHTHFFAPVVAALYLGLPIAPLNHRYSEGELKHALNISKPKVIFCSVKVDNIFLQLKKTLPFIEKIILVEPEISLPDLDNVEEFIKKNNSDVGKFQPVDVNPREAIAVILCSSGTTGLPKGVMLTHDNISMRMNQLSYVPVRVFNKSFSLGGL